MTITDSASPSPHIALRHRAPRDHASADGLRTDNQRAFQAFVDRNHHLFSDYVARRLSGPHSSSAEDALQEGLVRIWREWDEWPTDPDERMRFAHQALRIAALEAIRKRTGRDGSPRAGEITVDFADLHGHASGRPGAGLLARDLGRAIAEQSMVKDQIAYLEKASLIAAIATLTDLEQRVLFLTAQGDDCKQIARDLHVTHQQAREALMRARRLCRMLIEHADGQKVDEKEAKLLWQYRDGQLSGKRARELKRHIEHCTACQRLLGFEESITTNGALIILPIPALLLATGQLPAPSAPDPNATGHDPGSTDLAGAANVDLGVTLSQGTLAPAAMGHGTVGLLSGVTAKVGLALGALAATTSIAAIGELIHDRTTATTTPTPAHAAGPAPAMTTGRTTARTPKPQTAAVVHSRSTPRHATNTSPTPRSRQNRRAVRKMIATPPPQATAAAAPATPNTRPRPTTPSTVLTASARTPRPDTTTAPEFAPGWEINEPTAPVGP